MNYKRILSCNSIKSASSSGKSVSYSENKSELNSDIEYLKKVIESLKSSIESRDTAIGTLAREKEKVFVDLKSAQRTIRSLRQQLSDERTIYMKEKEFMTEEIQRLSKNENSEIRAQRRSLKQKNYILKEETIDSLKNQVREKDEIICKLCTKYIKLKNSKSLLHRKFQRLKIEAQEIRHVTICYLEENKQIMDKTFRKMFRSSTISSGSKKYLKLLNQNVKLSTENAQLKFNLSTNIQIDDKSEAKLHEDHENNSIVVESPPQQTQKSRQKVHEDLKNSSKSHWSDWTGYQFHRNKLNKSSYRLCPVLLGSLYRKNKSLSAKLLQDSLRKSTSMPCLKLV